MAFFYSGSSDVQDVRLGTGSEEVQASRVLVGNGSEAVEVWPGIREVDMDFEFNDQGELMWAPIVGFDARTSGNSSLNPGFTYNGMFVPGDNEAPTYHTRLINQQIDGPEMGIEVTIGDKASSIDHPAYVVLASTPSMDNMLVVEFGKDSLIFKEIIGSSTEIRYSASRRSFEVGDRFLFRFSENDRGRVYVTRNEISTTSFPMGASVLQNNAGSQYVGFGVYSSTGVWGSRLDRVRIMGTTTYPIVRMASERIVRGAIPQGGYHSVSTSTIPWAGSGDISLTDVAWYAPQNLAGFTRLLHNGVVVATSTRGAASLHSGPHQFSPNDTVVVEATSDDANPTNRMLIGGTLRVGDLTRFD